MTLSASGASLVNKISTLGLTTEFYTIANQLRNTVLSTSEAFTLFNTCYRNNYKDRQLFTNYIAPLENAFFGSMELTSDTKDYRAILLNLPVLAKVKIILGDLDDSSCQHLSPDETSAAKTSFGRKSRASSRLIIDAERFEKAGLRRLKRVTTGSFPVPKINRPVPGTRLANTLASSLREAIPSMSVKDLGNFCKIFNSKHYLTGSLMEDTIEKLVLHLAKCDLSGLSHIISDLSHLYYIAQERYIELQLDGIDSIYYPPISYPLYIKKLGRLIDDVTKHIAILKDNPINPEDSKKIAERLIKSGLGKFNIKTIEFWLENSNLQVRKDSPHKQGSDSPNLLFEGKS